MAELSDIGYAIPNKVVSVDNDECVAKCLVHSDSNRLVAYVKVDSFGHIFNPWGMTTPNPRAHNMEINGQPAYRWKRVSDKSFDFYLEFLKTKNELWYVNAEREMKDG